MLSADLADLKSHMAENPGAVIEDVARERKVTPRARDRGAAFRNGAHQPRRCVRGSDAGYSAMG